MSFFDRVRRVAALLADPKVAKLPRLAVLLAAVYLVSPIDFFPDFMVPVAGYLDDLLLVWAALKWLLGSAGEAGITPSPRAGEPRGGPAPPRP